MNFMRVSSIIFYSKHFRAVYNIKRILSFALALPLVLNPLVLQASTENTTSNSKSDLIRQED